MKEINGLKKGKIVNFSIDGKLYKKVFDTDEKASELFKLILDAKANPTEDSVMGIMSFVNEKTRIAMKCGLETDPQTGNVYMAGFNEPVPKTLVDIAEDYHENGFDLQPIFNFWTLLMLNPDKRVRTSLFDFINTHDFSLTDNGYMIVYKSVYRKTNDNEDVELAEYISNQFFHVKKQWSCSPKKYVVYKTLEDKQYHITKETTAENWSETERNIEILGNLNDMFENIQDYIVEDNKFPYTDMHTRSMDIGLGIPIKMSRTECDSDPARDCSYGLHVGATKYVEAFANRNCVILVCYVNPMNVVAVPDYDHSKMRVSEYFPFAIATYEDSKIDIVDKKYFPDDYTDYEKNDLADMIEKVMAEEEPISVSSDVPEDSISFEELQKIIENRLVTISK